MCYSLFYVGYTVVHLNVDKFNNALLFKMMKLVLAILQILATGLVHTNLVKNQITLKSLNLM